MQFDLKSIAANMGGLATQVTEIYHALVGSPISKDGGALKRLTDNEERTEELDLKITVIQEEIDKKFNVFAKEIIEKIDTIKTSNHKTEIYVRIIWGAAGALFIAALGFLAKFIFKIP